jgi:hypothetical protein
MQCNAMRCDAINKSHQKLCLFLKRALYVVGEEWIRKRNLLIRFSAKSGKYYYYNMPDDSTWQIRS